jgi:hypothetical protein
MSGQVSAGARLLASRLEALLGVGAVSAAAATARAVRRAAVSGDDTAAPLPDYVGHALARWHLLNDVPFRYLVPDARLLPLESIRFFTIDAAWLDALAAGALAMGGAGSRDGARARTMLPAARVAADTHRLFVRDVARGRLTLGGIASVVGTSPEDATPEPIVSGFLLRSQLVSGWPGMQLRAWTSDALADVPLGTDPSALAAAHPELVVPILRLERLAPSVMIALFDGLPRLVWIEEPHHGVQYGVEDGSGGATVPVRNESGQDLGIAVAVPMRTGAGSVSGVVNVAALAHAIDQARPLGQPRGSAALALTLMQAPSRQRFAAGAAAPAPVSVRAPQRRRVR